MFDRKRLKQRRTQLNYTLQDISDKIGLTRATVQKYESGYISDMTTTLLETFAKALECTPAYLMGWTNNPYGNDSPEPAQLPDADLAALPEDEKELMADYRKLNPTGKDKVREYTKDLSENDRYTENPLDKLHGKAIG